MKLFIARSNIKRFQEQLLASSDEIQKATLRQLLSDERQRLDLLLADPKLNVRVDYGNLRI